MVKVFLRDLNFYMFLVHMVWYMYGRLHAKSIVLLHETLVHMYVV